MPVDLDDERKPRGEVQFRHSAGFGPPPLECRLSDDGVLRCAPDEPLVRVESRAFACEKLPATEALTRQWRLFLTGQSGTAAEWVVEGRTVEQSRAAHLQ